MPANNVHKHKLARVIKRFVAALPLNHPNAVVLVSAEVISAQTSMHYG